MIFDPEMAAGLARLAEMRAEDLTPEQRAAVEKAIASIDRVNASVLETMKPAAEGEG
jgi:hypothetical protein